MKKRRLLSILLTLAMMLSLLPAVTLTASANDTVSYMAWDGTKMLKSACTDYTVVSSQAEWGTADTETWYVVNAPSANNLTVNTRIRVSGTVNLILCDGAKLNAVKGITVAGENKLNIYAGSLTTSVLGNGSLTAGTDTTDDTTSEAGIGGSEYQASGDITIYGGIVTAYGSQNNQHGGAGIGGGYEGAGGNITIYGGTVTAKGNNNGAGIGGGRDGAGGNITIYGGTVTANGGTYSAGIGGGHNGAGGTIKIYGGNLTATGNNGGAGIGGGCYNVGGSIEIHGGNVTASADEDSGAGIGAGNSCQGGTIEISGGNVTARSTYGAGIGGGSMVSGTTKIETQSINISGGNVTAYNEGRGAAIGGGNIGGGNIGGDFTVNISGGNVTAIAKAENNYCGAGIGGGAGGNGVDVTISGGRVYAEGGMDSIKGIGAGKKYDSSIGNLTPGTLTLSGDVALYAGETTALQAVTGYDASNVAAEKRARRMFVTTPLWYLNREWDSTSSSVTESTVALNEAFHLVLPGTTTWTEGNYVAAFETAIKERIVAIGAVKLFLCDGVKLTASQGVTVNEGNTLNIYAQSSGGSMGEVIADASVLSSYAGIGGSPQYAGGAVNIHGGAVTAYGGVNAAGIGGGGIGSGNTGGAGGAVTIYGGTVIASGVTGIGGGFNSRSNGSLTLGTGVKLYGDDSGPAITSRATGTGAAYTGPRYHNMKTACPHAHGATVTGGEKDFSTSISSATELTAISATGSYYLTDNITLSDTWTVPENKTIDLCLNGYGISADKSSANSFTGDCVISIPSGSTLNLYDCGTAEHSYYIGDDSLAHLGDALTGQTGGSFTGGYITGGGIAGVRGIENKGTFNLYGGTIFGNSAVKNGAGVAMVNSSTAFHMYGGAIIGNKVTGTGTNPNRGYGGGVFLTENVMFSMSGGTIAYNTATGDEGCGGGIYISKAFLNNSVTLAGGTITGNTALQGGGVYFNNGTLTVSNSFKITNNTAIHDSDKVASGRGGGLFFQEGTLNLAGGTITGNAARNGGGIYVNNRSTFNVSGAPQVKTNSSTLTGTDVPLSNVEFASATYSDFTNNRADFTVPDGKSLSENAEIGVSWRLIRSPGYTPSNLGPYQITTNLNGNGAAASFRSDDPYYAVRANASSGEAEIYYNGATLTVEYKPSGADFSLKLGESNVTVPSEDESKKLAAGSYTFTSKKEVGVKIDGEAVVPTLSEGTYTFSFTLTGGEEVVVGKPDFTLDFGEGAKSAATLYKHVVDFASGSMPAIVRQEVQITDLPYVLAPDSDYILSMSKPFEVNGTHWSELYASDDCRYQNGAYEYYISTNSAPFARTITLANTAAVDAMNVQPRSGEVLTLTPLGTLDAQSSPAAWLALAPGKYTLTTNMNIVVVNNGANVPGTKNGENTTYALSLAAGDYVLVHRPYVQATLAIEPLVCGTEVTVSGNGYTQTPTPRISVQPGAVGLTDNCVNYSYWLESASSGGAINVIPFTGTARGGVAYTALLMIQAEAGYEFDPAAGVSIAGCEDADVTVQGNGAFITAPITAVHDDQIAYYVRPDTTVTATAMCQASGCSASAGTAALTVTAPTLTVEGGQGSPNATLDADALAAYNRLTGQSITADGITYAVKNGSALEEAPTKAGTYTASLKVGTGGNGDVLISVEYTIDAPPPQTYKLTVVNGTIQGGGATGDYTVSDDITIIAANAPAGEEFDYWSVSNPDYVLFDDAEGSTKSTAVLYINGDVTVTAIYKKAPPVTPTITTQPADLSWTCGDATARTLTIAASITDTGSLSYQWFRGGTADFTPGDDNMILGATDASYSIPSPQTAEPGVTYYKCLVTNTKDGMNAAAASSAAKVTVSKAAPVIETFTLTLVDGTADPENPYYTADDVITITANKPADGKVFKEWTADKPDYVTFDDVNSATTSIRITGDVTVTATYKDAPATGFTLTVVDGTASPEQVCYTAADIITITANAPATGKVFKEWTADKPDYVTFDDATSATTSIRITGSVTVTATYEDATPTPPAKYTLTVVNGSGGGEYEAGVTVTIKANTPDEGKVFDKWTGTDGVSFADANAEETTVTMPAKNATVTANYKDAEPTPTAPSYGGGGSAATYKLNLPADTYGTITATPATAAKGTKVTLKLTPAEGFTAVKPTVLDKDGKPVEVTDNGDGTYSFTMPDGDVTVKGGFKGKFVDVEPDDWFLDAVYWAAARGITLGTDETHFTPNGDCTRAMFVTFLWRAAGEPAPSATECPFEDVLPDAYYYNAVLWAAETGVTLGTDETHFTPDRVVTRAEAFTFVYRYEKLIGKGFTGMWAFSLADFPDHEDVPEYAYEAFCWMIKEGKCQGCDGQLLPNAVCPRSQVVTLLMRVFG